MKILIILLVVMALCLVSMASAQPIISVSPQPTDVEIGATFTVDVTLDPMGDAIYAAQYDLSYNANILSVTTQTSGDFLSQGGAETMVPTNTIDNTIGKMTYSETRLGDPEGGASESGVLASITFEVIGDGISDLTLSNKVYGYPDEPEPNPTEGRPTDGEPDDTEEYDDHGSSGSSNLVAAPAATAATPTTTDDGIGSDSTPPSAEAEVVPTTELTAAVTPTKTPTKVDAPSQSGFKAPGFEAASLVVVLLYLIKRRGE